jgi:hypothetical protein
MANSSIQYGFPCILHIQAFAFPSRKMTSLVYDGNMKNQDVSIRFIDLA